MSTQSFDEEIQDNDPTDELPILTDVILGEDGAYTAAAPEPQAEADDSAAVRLQKDLDARDERLSTLESELMRLQERWSDTESALSERDDELSRLRDELSDRETAMEKQRAALDESANELQSQKTTIAELTSALELERERSAGLERSANELQQKISGLEDKIESIEAESEVARETSKQDGVDQPATRLREEVAALSQHIENRNAVWREQTDTLAAQSTRIRELEIELAQRLERQLEAERLAQRASADAHAAREQLGAALEKLRRSKPAEKRLAAPEAPRREEVSDEAISDDDHAAQLRRELAQTVLLQANQGDDAETLKRLAELEAAIMSLESQMDSPRDSAGVDSPAEPAKLICLTAEAPTEYVLDKPSVTIGRGASCDIQLATHYVSREHARITTADAGCCIEDLGSRNGVFVNAVKIERQDLAAGDLITVGDTQFRYEASGYR